jgi:hypothetical protein
MRVRIFWHPVEETLSHFSYEKITRAAILNAHYVYGLYLTFSILKYPYVITLEDDIEPGPDFYWYHLSLWEETVKPNSTTLAIGAFSHGPRHDCHYIVPKLTKSGNCTMRDMNVLLKESYFPGWGVGFGVNLFLQYYSVWVQRTTKEEIYDGTLLRLFKGGHYHSLIPCSFRVRYLPNKGVNGEGWHFIQLLPQLKHWFVPPRGRSYSVKNG